MINVLFFAKDVRVTVIFDPKQTVFVSDATNYYHIFAHCGMCRHVSSEMVLIRPKLIEMMSLLNFNANLCD